MVWLCEEMKKILIILLLIGILVVSGCVNDDSQTNVVYQCNSNNDCVSTCGAGCANRLWAETYNDPCVNIRAFDCSCENGLCYSDEKPPREPM